MSLGNVLGAVNAVTGLRHDAAHNRANHQEDDTRVHTHRHVNDEEHRSGGEVASVEGTYEEDGAQDLGDAAAGDDRVAHRPVAGRFETDCKLADMLVEAQTRQMNAIMPAADALAARDAGATLERARALRVAGRDTEAASAFAAGAAAQNNLSAEAGREI